MARKFNDSIDLAFNELQNVVAQNLAADPGTGVADGRLYYSTSANALRLRAGGSWTTIASGAGYTDEQAQDAVNALLVGGTHTGGLGFVYDDVGNTLSLTLSNNEAFQDVVGAFLPSAAGSSGITVTYDDTNNRMNYVVGGVAASAISFAATAKLLGRATAGAGTGEEVGLGASLAISAGNVIRAALTGDVTASADGNATTIANNAVTTVKITDANVTLAKLANVSTDSLIGRDTAGSGVPENILLNVTLSMDGSGNLQRSALTGDVTASAGSNATSIATDAVTTAKILNANVTLAKMANITTDSLIGRDTAASGVPEVITLSGDLSMTGSQVLQVSAYSGGDITKGAGATSATITNSAVTNAKLANMAANSIKGNNTGGSAVALDLTAAQVKTLLAIVPGDVSGLGSLATVSNLTGDVTSAGAATTIGANKVLTSMINSNAVDNTRLAQMAANSIKGNNTGGSANAVDLTVAQTKTLLAIVPGDVTGFDTQVRSSRLDQMTAPTASVSMNSQLLTNVLTPVSGTDAANKNYVDAAVTGQIWKNPVDAATTAALPALTYSAGAGTLTETANGALAAQDGVTLAVGDDLLVKDQASSFQNGIYTVTALGSGAAVFVLTRRADADSAAELRDAAVMVEAGTTQGGDIFTQTVSTLADLTAATQTWTKTGDTNTVYTADGSTLQLTGNIFAIKNNGVTATQISTAALSATGGLTGGGGAAITVNTGTGLEISSNNLRIAAAAAGNGLTGGGGSALTVNTGAGLEISGNAVRIAAAAAGNGLTGGAGSALAVDHTKVPLLFVQNVTGGATSEVVTHGLGTRDVMVRVYGQNTPWAEEEFTVEHTSTNTVTIRSSASIPAATYRVVVFG